MALAPDDESTLEHEDPDAALLRAHLAGDPEAFGALVARHRDRLWAVAVRTLGDREEAADALQDGLLNAYRRADGFRGDARVTTWLHRVVVNACLDRARRSALRAADPLPDDDAPGAVATPARHDPAEVAGLRADVRAALATLPVDQRAAVVLVDMAGYPLDEVAGILDCPVGTVKSRCARARARLVPLLAPGRRDRDPGRGNQAGRPPVTPADDTAALPQAARTEEGGGRP